jgi:hypothetical protein
VDSVPPVGVGRCDRVGSGLSLLSRICPSEAGEGFHSFEGPLAGSMSSTAEAGPGSETQEGTIRLAFSRMVGPGIGDGRFRSYSGGYSCTTSAECLNL